MHAPKHLLESIENGYRFPLKFIPPAHYQYNHKSSELHQSFVDEAIANLDRNRCITKVDVKPHICSPISVVSKWQENCDLC